MKRIVCGACLCVGLLHCGGTPTSGTDPNAANANERSDDPATQTPQTAQAKYPLVLAHGFSGFVKIGPIDYFYHVRAALEDAGYPVLVTFVQPFDSSEVRGEQLIAQIEAYLKKTGAKKVHLIGHSQGGLDARYVANRRPDLVDTVVSIGTPHSGNGLLDLADKAPKLGVVALEALLKIFWRPIDGPIVKEADLRNSLNALSSAGIARFNQRYGNDPHVRYYSIAGRSGDTAANDPTCTPDQSEDFIARYSSQRDPLDLMLTPLALLLPHPNDGMVGVINAKHGTFLGCIPADHLDEVGQLAGDRPGRKNSFDHLEFYKGLAAFLSTLPAAH